MAATPPVLQLNHRPRRLRRAPWLRTMVRETQLTPAHLVLPVFVIEGEGRTSEPIASMPGVARHTIESMIDMAREARALGIPAVALFPNTDPVRRNATASEALNPNNLVCHAVQALKQAVPGIGIITDVALDPYTDHGHDGIMIDGEVVNDETVAVLCQQALVQARAGADIIAPSDMMDGRVGAIRKALDEAGFTHVAIMAYTAKYASAFYGPFRDAVGSGSRLKGDKTTYQMDPANAREAEREAELDAAEGADIVMVKPGMAYLDIVARLRARLDIPVAAYQVSGEYAMLVAAFERGFLEREQAIMETLMAFRRSGCDVILTYFALEAARMLASGPTKEST